jgi:hypothetical protein
VRGSEVVEDPRRAGSLLRFAPSAVVIDLSASESNSVPVSCATLSRVPQLVSLEFLFPQPLMQMQLDEWRTFLQHPNAQRLTFVDICQQQALCDATSVSLLNQLPLLRKLQLCVPVEPSLSYFEPLANAPSLTELILWGSDVAMPEPVSLMPLARCTRLRSLSLHEVSLLFGELSGMLMQFAQAGGQLQELELADLRMFPMTDSVSLAQAEVQGDAMTLELSLAASSLTQLHTLNLSTTAISLDCVVWFPSLRWLELLLQVLPSASRLELLLRRLPQLRCIVQPRWSPHSADRMQNETKRLQLLSLAKHFSRLVIKEQQ